MRIKKTSLANGTSGEVYTGDLPAGIYLIRCRTMVGFVSTARFVKR